MINRIAISLDETLDRAAELLIRKHGYSGLSDFVQHLVREEWRREFGSFAVDFDEIEKQISHLETQLFEVSAKRRKAARLSAIEKAAQ